MMCSFHGFWMREKTFVCLIASQGHIQYETIYKFTKLCAEPRVEQDFSFLRTFTSTGLDPILPSKLPYSS